MRRVLRWSTRVGVGLTLALPIAALPTMAHAETKVRVDLDTRGELIVQAAPGVANRISIRRLAENVEVRDAADLVPAGPGCKVVDKNAVSCSLQGVSFITVHAGDGNDIVNFDATNDGPIKFLTGFLNGEAGNDALVLGPNATRGNLNGGPGEDWLDGGRGTSRLDGGEGADFMLGGAGSDAVDYSGRNKPVQADPDSTTGDDGEVDEEDSIGADVEQIFGGDGDDELTAIGKDVANVLHGNGGDDILNTLDEGKTDDVDGGSGNNTCKTDEGDTKTNCLP